MNSQPKILKPHVSLNVSNVDRAVAFYSKVFAVAPVKHYKEHSTMHSVLLDDQGKFSTIQRTGYAKFDLQEPSLNLVLNEVSLPSPNAVTALSHLGIQVESSADIAHFQQRFEAAGLVDRPEMQINCCYAKQDKTWLADPDGNEWEFFVVLDHLAPSALAIENNAPSDAAQVAQSPVAQASAQVAQSAVAQASAAQVAPSAVAQQASTSTAPVTQLRSSCASSCDA